MRRIVAIWIATFALTVAVGYRMAPGPVPSADATSLADFLQNPNLISAEGRDIEIISIPATTTETYRFYVQGGLHGNELAAPRFVRWLAKRMQQGDSPLLQLSARGVAFDMVPASNPDGLASHHRYNAAGVNLNRNFDVLWGTTRENPGPEAFSEPETNAIKTLFKARKYDAAIDIHGYINWVVAPTPPAILGQMAPGKYQDRSEEYQKWYGAMRQEMTLLPNYELHTAGGLGDGGAFEDWAFWQEGVLSLCLELQDEQQFARPYRKLFENLNQTANVRVDKFKRYEAYLFRMFDHATKLRAPRTKDDIASIK